MSMKTKFLLVAVGLCFVSSNILFASSNKAEDALSKGKKFYADGRYDEAMDSFVDVFVSGNPDQIAEANEYVNLIHFERGGVIPPKQVPYDKEIEDRQNIGVQGRNLYDKDPKKTENSKEPKEDSKSLKEVFAKEKAKDDIPEPPNSVPEADPFAKPEPVKKSAEKDSNTEVKDKKDTKAETATKADKTKEDKDTKTANQSKAAKDGGKDTKTSAKTDAKATVASASGAEKSGEKDLRDKPQTHPKAIRVESEDQKVKNQEKIDAVVPVVVVGEGNNSGSKNTGTKAQPTSKGSAKTDTKVASKTGEKANAEEGEIIVIKVEPEEPVVEQDPEEERRLQEEAEAQAKEEQEKAAAEAKAKQDKAAAKAQKKQEKAEAKAKKKQEKAEAKAKKKEEKAKKKQEKAEAKAKKKQEKAEAKAKKQEARAVAKSKNKQEKAEAWEKQKQEESEDRAVRKQEVEESRERKKEEKALKNKKIIVPKDLVVDKKETTPRGGSYTIRANQKKKEKEQRQRMRDELLSKLKSKKDVQIYMRDGKVDAIDIPSDILFNNRTINKSATDIMDYVYGLMVVENPSAYYILPEGSFTDDITVQNVRQAVSLHSYLMNRGISPAKMHLNMGLSSQEPPEKFRNLAGTAIIFDYKGKANLKPAKLQEKKNLPPALSLAVAPFEEIIPDWDETFLIDFSVMETAAPIKKWTLQIISHEIDGHFYVLKQLSGKTVLTNQFFWNGRKRYFGQPLPLGNYTVVLWAIDTENRERLLKRKVVLKEAPRKFYDEYEKTEEEVKKEEKKAEVQEVIKAKSSTLNYKQKRLWQKPGKKLPPLPKATGASQERAAAAASAGMYDDDYRF